MAKSWGVTFDQNNFVLPKRGGGRLRDHNGAIVPQKCPEAKSIFFAMLLVAMLVRTHLLPKRIDLLIFGFFPVGPYLHLNSGSF